MKSECEHHAWGDDSQGRLSTNPYQLLAALLKQNAAMHQAVEAAEERLRTVEGRLLEMEAELAGRVE